MANADKKFTLLVEAIPGQGGTQAFDQQTAAMKKAEEAAKKLEQANKKAASSSGAPTAADAELAKARLSFEEKYAAAKAKLTQTTQSQTVATEALAGGALPRLAGAIGLAATAIAGARAVWSQMLADNEKLAKSWENLKQAGADVFSGVVRDLTGNGETLKTLFDSVTKALGGTTDEMKKALGPFSDYVKLSTEATTAAEKFTKALNDQARAAELDREKLKTLGAERDSITKQLREQEDARIAAEREDTNNNPDLNPEQRKAQLDALDQQERDLKRQRRREDAVTAQEDAATELEMAQKALEERQKAEDDQRQRVKAARELDDARTAANDYQARKKADPNFFNGMDPGQAIKNEKAIEDRLKAAQGAAKSAFGDTPFSDPKAEVETLRRAEQERQKAEQDAAKAAERFKREALNAEEEQRAADVEAIREEEKIKRDKSRAPAETPDEEPNKATAPTAPDVDPGKDTPPPAPGSAEMEGLTAEENDIRARYMAGKKLTYGERQKLERAVRRMKKAAPRSAGSGYAAQPQYGGANMSYGPAEGVSPPAPPTPPVRGDGRSSSPEEVAIRDMAETVKTNFSQLASVVASLASHMSDATKATKNHASRSYEQARSSTLSIMASAKALKSQITDMRRIQANELL